MSKLSKDIFGFLDDLKVNNNRDWMQEHKKRYQENEKKLKLFYSSVAERLNESDEIDNTKIYRINRDIRFSKDKTPYNIHRSVGFSRAGAHRRGGYYLRIESGNSKLAGGFFSPNPTDLLRIRKEFEMDDQEIRDILDTPDFKKAFGGFTTDNQVKTAPKGFSKEHSAIDLIKNKSFIVVHSFTNKEVCAPDFLDKVVFHFELLRPFFDYMSDVLTTDLNGVSLLED
ncbi:DUF2461 domain-containing protein [Aquimarina hainanensis]|uniref:DUF2461 domain-containing protein n=1 Tax=Aquimarina hainanensis TaxID=1578017 RepID=A0ABW5NCE2_9FLAO